MSTKGATTKGGEFHARFSKSVSASLTRCAPEVGAYGGCIKAGMPDVQKGMCEAEFGALKKCFRKALRESLRSLKQ